MIFKSNARTKIPETLVTDEQLAEQLKMHAKMTADIAGTLTERGWRVSVTIFPSTSDKGPTSIVNVYRTQTLTGE